MRLGVAWPLFDETTERAFFREWALPGRLRPRNDFMRRKLEERAICLAARQDVRTENILSALPRSLPSEWVTPIRDGIRGGALETSRKTCAIAVIGDLL